MTTNTTVRPSGVSDNDLLVAFGVAAFLGPALLMGIFRGLRAAALTWALNHHFLTRTYMVGIPGTDGRGLDGGHLLLTLGLLGMCGLIGVLLGRALMPRHNH